MEGQCNQRKHFASTFLILLIWSAKNFGSVIAVPADFGEYLRRQELRWYQGVHWQPSTYKQDQISTPKVQDMLRL